MCILAVFFQLVLQKKYENRNKKLWKQNIPNSQNRPVGWTPAESPLDIMEIPENYLEVKHCTWPVSKRSAWSGNIQQPWHRSDIQWTNLSSGQFKLIWKFEKSRNSRKGGLFSVSSCPLTAVWWLTFLACSRVLAGGCFGVMVEYNDIRTLVWGLKNNLSVVGSWRHVPVI